MRRSDWLLVFLAAEAGTPLDPVRVQKGMFQLAMSELVAPEERYAFEPYAYGPMSRDLYRDVRSLCRRGLVVATPSDEASWHLLQPTTAGSACARDLRDGVTDDAAPAVEQIGAIRRRITGLTFTELLRYVYERYPDYAVRSVFRDAP